MKKGWKGEGKGKKYEKEWTQPQKQKKGVGEVMGYDGTRISLAAYSQSSSSLWPPKQEENKPDGLAEIKAFLRDIVTEEQTSNPTIQKLLAEDPNDAIKQQQKDLNKKRKKQRRIEALQKQEETKEEAFVQWKAAMKTMIKAEEVRHKEAMSKLKEELQQALRESEDEKDDKMQTDQSSDEEEAAVTGPLKKLLEESEERCRQLAQNNSDMTQKMQELINAMQRAQPPHQPELPAKMPDQEALREVEESKVANTTPMVASPSVAANASVMGTADNSDPMKPFRNGKPPRETPYTPKTKSPTKAKDGPEDAWASVETLE